MGTLYTFPAKFIYYEQIEKHQQFKEYVMSYVENELTTKGETYLNDREVWDCKVITSFFDETSMPLMYFPEIQSEIWRMFDNMLKEVNLSVRPKHSYITKSWFNLYKKGYNQEVHQHSGSEISGIYILHSTEENKTAFYSQEHHLMLNKTFTTEFMKEGTIILFPSHLAHYVNPIEDEKRITIAFNISCDL